MKRPTPVYRQLKCGNCGGELRDWDCYCSWGCDACDLRSECTKCGKISKAPAQAEVKTAELLAYKEWQRERSRKANEKHNAEQSQKPKPKSPAARLREARVKCPSNT